ncbi:hypothetical protein [Shewanella glacialipiscicola]|uniref:hypothetical protein n=1 Tax=Shewanella glacialipiscicola TaxID=614069 RepID=UPI003D7BE3D2
MYSLSFKQMQDTNREARYFSTFLIAKAKTAGSESCVNIAGSCYNPNAKTLTHICRFKKFESYGEAEKAFEKKSEEKLKRERKFIGGGIETFETLDELKNFASSFLKMSIGDAKRLAATISSSERELEEASKMSFEEIAETRLKSAEDFTKIEKAAGVGKETAKINSNWGMF